MTKAINAALLKNMVISAANTLNDNKGYVDSLNVFPVPDGDTGTNMALTFMSAAREIDAGDFPDACKISSLVAKATLRGARGNSGVILSQIFRGISQEFSGKSVITVPDFARALQKGSDTAYHAVMKPTEGTILTVVRKMAKAASDFQGEDFEDFFAAVNERGKAALDKTPDLLPQLKQAGVVDAGGRGLLFIFEGMANALSGEEYSLRDAVEASVSHSAQQSVDPNSITFTYCTEFIIEKYNESMTADNMRREISSIGDCMLIIEENDVIKVHIHTNNPGFVIEQAVKLGELVNIKIDNMKHQHNSIISEAKAAPEPPKTDEPKAKLAVIAVAAGSGIEEIFTELGVSKLILGGQTMNPSTDDILAAIDSANAENVIILPNNKNIILSSGQAKELSKTHVHVIPTKTIPQGITAMLSFIPDGSVEDNVSAMTDAVSTVKSGSVTHAVRDTSLENIEIHEGDYLGMLEGDISVVGQNLETTVLNLLENMSVQDENVITLYYGEDVSGENAEALANQISDIYPECDVSARRGDQPVYYYFVSVE